MSIKAYEEAVRQTWRHTEGSPSGEQGLQRELVRYATLAPSSHNTQCWKFALDDRHISILPDLSRRCPAVDPDDHHLFVSLGCAAENLVQAGLIHGWNSEVHFDQAAGGAVADDLGTDQAHHFPAIPGDPVQTVLANGI